MSCSKSAAVSTSTTLAIGCKPRQRFGENSRNGFKKQGGGARVVHGVFRKSLEGIYRAILHRYNVTRSAVLSSAAPIERAAFCSLVWNALQFFAEKLRDCERPQVISATAQPKRAA